MRLIYFYCLIILLVSNTAYTQVININIDKPTAPKEVQSTMWGVFFEDINFAADGGLYAELIKNRSFEFDTNLLGWTPFGNVKILSEDPAFSNNPNFVRLNYSTELTGTGVENEGFDGIGLKKNEEYTCSYYVRLASAESTELVFELLSENKSILFRDTQLISNRNWKKVEFTFKSPIQENSGSIRLVLNKKGIVDIDHVSLFPVKTFKNRKNGLREDIAASISDLDVGLFRFPGGCIVEGTTLETRYQWKNTIGPVENRPTIINRWNYIFPHRRFVDYYQSNGLGFYEYFLFSEDIGAEPLPVINCGLICQFVSKSDSDHCSIDDLSVFIQDALDLIEFANGEPDSKWGSVRVSMGHPEPFNLKFIGIGNEQWGEEYSKRLALISEAIRKVYPAVKIVGSSGPYPDGKDFNYGWKALTKLKIDLIDEHYYRDPEWFLGNAKRYDSYNRRGPKVFAGEYACHTGERNNFYSALCEAAFMTGLERNADVVHMTAYAPLLAHKNNWQWRPDLIWFDNLSTLKTPNYFVQQLFSKHKGDFLLETKYNGEPLIGADSLYASAVLDTAANQVYVKLINTSTKDIKIKYNFKKVSINQGIVKHISIIAEHPRVENTFENPDRIKPKIDSLNFRTNTSLAVKPQSINLYVFDFIDWQ